MTASAFAPAHVSGVFAVHDEAADLLRKGSRGAGWSLEAGARAQVDVSDTMHVAIDGKVTDAPVTLDALARLAPRQAFEVAVQLELPVGQGFGMSAAGTLAACLAAANVLDLEPERALEATHAAEVASGTGLGDAIGSWFGCGEVRMKPGCPPHGWALRVEPPEDTRFLFCVLGAAIATPTIIRDEAWKAKTRALGDPVVDRILAAGREAGRGSAAEARKWHAILSESSAFGKSLGLMPDAMRRLGQTLPLDVIWGQSMLGNTMWVTGPATALDAARTQLETVGRVIACGVDMNGARIVRGTR